MPHGAALVLSIFVLLLSAAGIGTLLHGRLRERHRTNETVDHVRMVVSILVTFTALGLSLLLSEVKASFDTLDARVRAFAGDLSNLDTHLREYGPDAEPVRALLREYVAAAIADTWRDEPPPAGNYPRFAKAGGAERQQFGALLIKIDTAIRRLDAPDRFHERVAQSLSNQIDQAVHARRQLIETARNTIAWPLMLAMCAWLSVIFAVFGLLSPRNVVVHLSIVTCALCVASAVFLINDFDSPLDGVLHISSQPMRDTLGHIDERAAEP